MTITKDTQRFPHVQMIAKFTVLLPKDFDMNTANFDIGGFEMTVDGKNIPFDFEATCLHIQSTALCGSARFVSFEYKSGNGPFFNEPALDPCHEDMWRDLGLTAHDLTAKYLAGASKITEFYFSACDSGKYEDGVDGAELVIESLAFNDETETFPVASKVLASYQFPDLGDK